MDEFDEMMKSLGQDEAEEEAEQPLLGEGEDIDPADLDAELERLLSADQVADEEFEFEEITAGSLVSTRSIYDSGGIIDDNDNTALVYSKADAEAEARRLNKRSLLDTLSVRGLLTAGFILLFVFIGAGASVVLAARAVAEQRDEAAAMAHFTPISMPVNVANNANLIHINELVTIGAQNFTLLRMSVGFSGVYIFFEEHFDVDAYYIFLYDQNRRLYVRHGFDMRHDASLGTILRFDALRGDAQFLTLHIQHRETREYGAFRYRLVGSFAVEAPVFITQPISLAGAGDVNSGLRISHAQFNNVESAIYYSFNGNFEAVGLRRREGSAATFVHMWDGLGGLAAMTEPRAVIYCHARDAQMGRATFAPLMSLNSQVRVSFHDLYYVYPNPPVDIPLRFLGGRDMNDPHTLHLDQFRLNLEGMQQQGHLLVLVMHGLDAAGLRLRTVVEAGLKIDIGRGQTLTIEAEQVNVADNGTDVVFNLRPHLDVLNNAHIDRYTLLLHYVEFAVPEVSITLDLAQAVHQPSARREAVIAHIEAAFESRLAYMSGEIAQTSLIGFAPAVLTDTAEFFARRTLAERPLYGASVILGDFYDNYTFLAVVEAEWILGTGAELEFIRTVHQVTARSHEGIWSIVADEFITP